MPTTVKIITDMLVYKNDIKNSEFLYGDVA